MDKLTRRRTSCTEESVERDAVLDADPQRAWAAISDPEMLERWLADEVKLEPVEGAPARFTIDGEDRHGRVERVVEGHRLDFSWEREPGCPSLVELELTPCVSGTRIRVIETRGWDGPRAHARAGAGWSEGLASMRSLFTMVAA